MTNVDNIYFQLTEYRHLNNLFKDAIASNQNYILMLKTILKQSKFLFG